jgi:hypothetical protein
MDCTAQCSRLAMRPVGQTITMADQTGQLLFCQDLLRPTSLVDAVFALIPAVRVTG